MSNVYSVNEKMHKIRAKLYPNYLPGGEGTYIARTTNEDSVTVEDICAAMKNRGGYSGSYEDAVQTVRQFHQEMARHLCEGFSVNTGFFSIRPNIVGIFQSEKESYNPEKQSLGFRFHSLKALRDLQNDIDVVIDGKADVYGYIAEFVDTDENSINGLYVPGDQFVISGHKIKVTEDDPETGVFFVPVDDPARAVRAARVVENTASRIIGITPKTGYMRNRIEIRTQYTGSETTPSKTPHVIASAFILEES